jgi:AcrR family transcriptional regulator
VKKTGSKKNARNRILEATIALLLETRDISALTVRTIAKKADVGIGLVNYHFGDKESLVREAARLFIARQIIKGYGDRPPEAATLRGRIAALFSGPIGFLSEFPRLSRISVIYDLVSPGEADNSDDTFRELESALRKLVPPGALPPDLGLRLWAVISTVHEAFLRPERFSARTGLDFSSVSDRAAIADFLAGLVFKEPPMQ